jgi:hypothetical protein
MKRIKMPSFKSLRGRKWLIVFFVAITVILFIGGEFVSHYAAQQIERRLYAAGGSASSVDVNLFFQRISLTDFKLNPDTDSAETIPVKAEIQTITLKGVGLYQLIINKKLKIKDVVIANGSVRVNRKTSATKPRDHQKPAKIKKIFVGRILIQNINTAIASDSVTQWSGILNITLNNVHSSDTASIDNIKAYQINDIEAKMTNLSFNDLKGFYEIRVAALSFSSNEKKLRLDSLILAPKHPKYKFSRVVGKQIDRVNTSIPHLEITGLQYNQLRDSSFIATKIEINSPEVFSFRDKRMEFKETKNKPLPIEAIKRFNFGIEVDTVKITDGKITYEEFPPDGFKSGAVVFEDLQATLVNVSDKVYQNRSPYATLNASAKIMGQGLIQASFSLPLDGKKPYHAKGKIGPMPLYHINPALENLAFIKIESGTLNNLNFDFNYNDRVSNGTLIINYQDLKIIGLKKEKSKNESDLKTFLINAVVKNDKNKEMPAEKRTGTIEFERDRKRQIFNFWWKSLLSGIKASVLTPDKDSGKSKGSKR